MLNREYTKEYDDREAESLRIREWMVMYSFPLSRQLRRVKCRGKSLEGVAEFTGSSVGGSDGATVVNGSSRGRSERCYALTELRGYVWVGSRAPEEAEKCSVNG